MTTHCTFARTPGKDLERRLNHDYGPGNAFYDDFCDLVKKGIDEGWAASGELDGPKYRRGRIALPCAETLFMSITTVFFDSKDVYAGQYHKVSTSVSVTQSSQVTNSM